MAVLPKWSPSQPSCLTVFEEGVVALGLFKPLCLGNLRCDRLLSSPLVHRFFFVDNKPRTS